MKNRLKKWYRRQDEVISIVIFMLSVIFFVIFMVALTVSADDESLKPKCSETYNIGYWVEDGDGAFRMTEDETAKYCPEFIK